jgi:16S rRNA (cytosine967-C5)-methyltransferase
VSHSRPRGGDVLSRGGVTEARAAVTAVCTDMRAGELLDIAFEKHVSELDARDRRWSQELLWGMLRRRSWLDAVIDLRVRGGFARLDPDLQDLLRLGTYQLLFMGSVPAYAAIAQTVELAKRRHGIGASKLVNAVLRRIDRERDSAAPDIPVDPIEQLALEFSHPRWIVARWVARWGAAETRRLLEVNNRESRVIVRPIGIVREQLEAMLESGGVSIEDVPLVSDSIAITGGVSLTELGAFRQGLFYVQDPAQTLVTTYASVSPGSTALDVCAAPGGKSIELSRVAGRVIAADRSESRVRRMMRNFDRLDIDSILPVVADARHSALVPADAVLVDAPCTGTGTFRRHPDARWRLKVSDLAVMGALQRAIIDEAASLVKPGGLLIYSTCSLEPEENDSLVEKFLAEHPDFRLEPPAAGVVPDDVLDAGRLRVLPQRHGTDGAFAARLRRRTH